MALTNQQAACALKTAGWPQDLIPTMVSVGHPESGLDPGARNAQGISATGGPGPYHAIGWLQVVDFPSRTSRWNLTDPVENAKAALEVYHEQGLGAWSTYPSASAPFLAAVQADLNGFDYGKCGAAAAASSGAATKTGTGLMAGRQTDPWGIGQSIADSAGYSGSALGGIGRSFLDQGTVLLGVLILGAGAALLGWLFLTRTSTGREIRRAAGGAGKAAAAAAAVVPK
jgi:hypothetical protein